MPPAVADALISQYGPEVPQRIATMLQRVHPAFDGPAFLADVANGYDTLGLMARGTHMAHALRRHLPTDFEVAVDLLVASTLVGVDMGGGSLAPFTFLPHTCFVAEYGLPHFESSMRAQHALTQVFTAEFSIRPFLVHHTQATLKRLALWANDPSEHVRRLVSEGTRPRLPWGQRLRAFQADPAPVLALLELLKDDPSLYVRRSVANNLNDIGKDHPDALLAVARRWWHQPTAQRRWLVTHALRSRIKAGDPGALALLGFGAQAQVTLTDVHMDPPAPRMGQSVRWRFGLHNPGTQPQSLLVDCGVHFVKASGQARLKVFKLKTVELAPGCTEVFGKTLSLAPMTTRQLHPGLHRVDVLINGVAQPLGVFNLLAAG